MTDTIKPVAWMSDDGHPRHISALQSGTSLRLHGPWQPLYSQAALDAAVAQERQECIDIVARHGGSIEIEAAIRARAALGE